MCGLYAHYYARRRNRQGAVIDVGTVVTKEVADYAIVGGVPE